MQSPIRESISPNRTLPSNQFCREKIISLICHCDCDHSSIRHSSCIHLAHRNSDEHATKPTRSIIRTGRGRGSSVFRIIPTIVFFAVGVTESKCHARARRRWNGGLASERSRECLNSPMRRNGSAHTAAGDHTLMQDGDPAGGGALTKTWDHSMEEAGKSTARRSGPAKETAWR